jgi:hypothetical protein
VFAYGAYIELINAGLDEAPITAKATKRAPRAKALAR